MYQVIGFTSRNLSITEPVQLQGAIHVRCSASQGSTIYTAHLQQACTAGSIHTVHTGEAVLRAVVPPIGPIDQLSNRVGTLTRSSVAGTARSSQQQLEA